jgi:tetratricopeptide (TPR) repeat protein
MNKALIVAVLITAICQTHADIVEFEIIVDDPNITFQSVEYYIARVNGYIEYQYLDNAERELKEGLQKYPDNIDLLLLHGKILYFRGDVEGEYQYYTSLLDKYPRESKIYFMRSFCDADLGNAAQYLYDLKKTIELDPKNAVAFGNIGLYYLQMGDYLNSEKYLLLAHEIDSQMVSVLNNLASVNYQMQKNQEAIEWANKTLQLNAENPIAYQIRGLSQIALGNKEDGEKDLQRAKEIQQSQKE